MHQQPGLNRPRSLAEYLMMWARVSGTPGAQKKKERAYASAQARGFSSSSEQPSQCRWKPF